jgi:aldose sugar dehydrogenase
MKRLFALVLLVPLIACAENSRPFTVSEVASFDRPWALDFLPDGRLLVTEKRGRLTLMSQDGKRERQYVGGVPEVVHGGQGGLGDVVVHPDFSENGYIYLSYAEAGDDNTRGAAVARARLRLTGEPQLEALEVIWRQVPKVSGRGHYGHRLAFSADGYLFISSGDRQKFSPAQDMQSNLGKILRLYDDGSVPADNPFAAEGGVSAEIWSLGHRNPLGLAFAADGRLWNHEMGPKGGDELNLVRRGHNYGYPIVSNGDHYDNTDIPDHPTRPEFTPPAVWWTPVISPSGFAIYGGTLFADWQGDGFITGLSSESLVRIEFDGDNAREAERFDMGRRIRAVREGPDGALWLLEDGSGGRLIRLTPAS